MVDLDKFICSLIKRYCEANFIDRSRIRCWLDDVLEDCGVEYKDGKLVRIQEKRTPVTIEYPYGKETLYMTDEQKDLFESSCKELSTIKFNEPDIDAMVEDFWYNKDVIISSHTRGMVEEAYRQGLEDMYKRLKG